MSTDINRKGHGRRLPTDAAGITSVDHDDAPPRWRFYASYQYFRLEPGEPINFDEDVLAKRSLIDRGTAAAEQSLMDHRASAERHA